VLHSDVQPGVLFLGLVRAEGASWGAFLVSGILHAGMLQERRGLLPIRASLRNPPEQTSGPASWPLAFIRPHAKGVQTVLYLPSVARTVASNWLPPLPLLFCSFPAVQRRGGVEGAFVERWR